MGHTSDNSSDVSALSKATMREVFHSYAISHAFTEKNRIVLSPYTGYSEDS